jgi:hypothetical protein
MDPKASLRMAVIATIILMTRTVGSEFSVRKLRISSQGAASGPRSAAMPLAFLGVHKHDCEKRLGLAGEEQARPTDCRPVLFEYGVGPR